MKKKINYYEKTINDNKLDDIPNEYLNTLCENQNKYLENEIKDKEDLIEKKNKIIKNSIINNDLNNF